MVIPEPDELPDLVELPVVLALVLPFTSPDLSGTAAAPAPEAPATPAWANATVFESTNAVANAIVVSFMVVSFLPRRQPYN